MNRTKRTGLPTPPVAGIICGIVAVIAWAFYNVGTKLGSAEGFRPQDMAVLRFGVAGLVTLPLVVRAGLGTMGGIGWGRSLALATVVGPFFALLVNSGFMLAPLAHGVTLGPAATMTSATLLAWKFNQERPSAAQFAGMAFLLAGLLALAGDGLAATGETSVWLGDLAFLASGTAWGSFTTLLKLWRIPPLQGAAAVSVLSMVLFVPADLLLFGFPVLPAGAVAAQAVFQGLLGGVLGITAYSFAVSHLGAGRAALFPALVPATATLVGVPLLGHRPTAVQVAGIALCSLGLGIAMVSVYRRAVGAAPQGRAEASVLPADAAGVAELTLPRSAE